jgi:hypothetical protein
MVPPIAAHLAGQAANVTSAGMDASIARLIVTERYAALAAPAPIVERIAILFLL